MSKYIIKRNGERQHFKAYKIEDAIQKAFSSVNQPYNSAIFTAVIQQMMDNEINSVEDIQDIIEKILFDFKLFAVLKAFITYRFMHKMQREHLAGLNEDTTYIDCTATVDEYINGTDWRINANSNTTYSNAGLVNNSAGKVIANYWLDNVYTKEEGYAHRNGDYHIHDLDCLTGYCAGWSLRVLLDEGFNGVRNRVSSRPPKHFREALGQMANFLGILQSEWAGAQAFSSFDTYLAPYVFKDNLSYVEVKKAICSFIYNLNVPARWGQSPFTNVTIDWVVPEDLKTQIPTSSQQHLFTNLNSPEFISRCQQRGVDRPEAMLYGAFQPELDMINRAFYTVLTEGDSSGQPFTFPIPTVNITEEFDWDGANVDLLFENTAKMGSSYFQNFVGSQYMLDDSGIKIENPEAYKPNAVRSMCCRLQLDLRELLKRGGGLFGSAEMTGSIGVVTINMARLGYLYKNDWEGLLSRLEELMDLATATLEKKRHFIQTMYDRGLYPYTARYLTHFRNHFSTIGVNGINEMIRNYSEDRESIATEAGSALGIEILEYMRNRIRNYQEETGNLYNLEATPAEGTTYRFAKEDKKRYSDIIQAGTGENIYYTNSSQLPSSYTSDPFEALELQDDLQTKYTGGTVLHLYMNERISDSTACKKLVKRIIENYRLPYITISPLFSICDKHGYLSGEHQFCPLCDAEILVKHHDDNNL